MKDVYMLTITGVTVKMTGNYRCVATNNKGTADHSSMITISDGKIPVKKQEEMKLEEKPIETKPEEKKLDEHERIDVEQIQETEAQFVLERSTEEIQQAGVSLYMTDEPEYVKEAASQLILEQSKSKQVQETASVLILQQPEIEEFHDAEEFYDATTELILKQPESEEMTSQFLLEQHVDALPERPAELATQKPEEQEPQLILEESTEEIQQAKLIQSFTDRKTDAKKMEETADQNKSLEKPTEKTLDETMPAAMEQEVEAQFIIEKSVEDIQQHEVGLFMTMKPEGVQEAATQLILEQPKPDQTQEAAAQIILEQPDSEEFHDATTYLIVEPQTFVQVQEGAAQLILEQPKSVPVHEDAAQLVQESTKHTITGEHVEAIHEKPVETTLQKPEETEVQFALVTLAEENKEADISLSMAPTPSEQVSEATFHVQEHLTEAAPEKSVDTGAPTFVKVYEEMTILEKKTLTLTVKITGKPAPEVQWFR